jgi:hypothetical protein
MKCPFCNDLLAKSITAYYCNSSILDHNISIHNDGNIYCVIRKDHINNFLNTEISINQINNKCYIESLVLDKIEVPSFKVEDYHLILNRIFKIKSFT